MDHVGEGGDARFRMAPHGYAGLDMTWICATAGDSGRAGAGGSSIGAMGGGGGGGYSGGGGGGMGPSTGEGSGNDGGEGGALGSFMANGGDASVKFEAFEVVLSTVKVRVYGGNGGDAGPLGASSSGLPFPGGWDAGGGGGGYSAGGGGGNGIIEPNGAGGRAGEVGTAVGRGGDVAFDVMATYPAVSRGSDIIADKGPGGWATGDFSAWGSVGGQGKGIETMDGSRTVHIPMSMTILQFPINSTRINKLPNFVWMPIHASTTNGDVDSYTFMLDDDKDFSSPMMVRQQTESNFQVASLPFGTFYWKVTVNYVYPEAATGPLGSIGTFTFFNAPPMLVPPDKPKIAEKVSTMLNFAKYVFDSDSPISALRLMTDDPAVVDIDGLNITFYYPRGPRDHMLSFYVTDGISTVSGRMQITVIDINEMPEITLIAGQPPPATIEMEEDSVSWVDIEVVDPDGDPIWFEIFKSWRGVSLFKNGTLRARSLHGEIGTFYAYITVEDGRDGVCGTRIKFIVKNVPDPPTSVEVFGPENRSVFYQWQTVTFTVAVRDPDIIWGDMVSVSWSSDVSGDLRTVTTSDVASYSTSTLPPGPHRIRILIDDGTFTMEKWLDIEIKERGLGPGSVDPPSESSLLLLIFLFVVMPLMGYIIGLRGVGHGEA